MKKISKAIAIFLIIAFIIYIYSRFIEPEMLSIHYENISSPYVAQKSNIKILQFSDIHLSDYFDIEDLNRVVDKINGEHPDIVVFTGDLIDHYNDYNYKGDIDKIWGALKRIDAPLGKFAVYGNHDYGGGGEKAYSTIMSKGEFTILVNERIKLDRYKLNIVGLDDSIFGNTDKNKLIDYIDKDLYNLVISHEPDIIDSLLELSIDLFLSGHSHGGQVNVPIVSTNMLPPLAENYTRGIYRFENHRDTLLYVNVGIGTSQVPLRFMSVPEISVFTLKNE